MAFRTMFSHALRSASESAVSRTTSLDDFRLTDLPRDWASKLPSATTSSTSRVKLTFSLFPKGKPASRRESVKSCPMRDVARIDARIGQLLTLSRLEAGLPLGKRENVNFTLLVEEVVADGNFEAQSLGKSVSLKSSSDVVLETADSLALRSACENIVRNAIRFTRPGTEVNVALDVDNTASSRQVFLTV